MRQHLNSTPQPQIYSTALIKPVNTQQCGPNAQQIYIKTFRPQIAKLASIWVVQHFTNMTHIAGSIVAHIR